MINHLVCNSFFFNDTATTEIYTLSYTTLFRSTGARSQEPGASREKALFGEHTMPAMRVLAGMDFGFASSVKADYHRSEEHTSELQSQSNLVCRLLLEKKKNTTEASRSVSGEIS